MCKWEDIQTKTELEFVLDVLKEKIVVLKEFFHSMMLFLEKIVI